MAKKHPAFLTIKDLDYAGWLLLMIMKVKTEQVATVTQSIQVLHVHLISPEVISREFKVLETFLLIPFNFCFFVYQTSNTRTDKSNFSEVSAYAQGKMEVQKNPWKTLGLYLKFIFGTNTGYGMKNKIKTNKQKQTKNPQQFLGKRKNVVSRVYSIIEPNV